MATQQAYAKMEVNQGATKRCGFCRSEIGDDRHSLLINGKNDYRPWIKDLPFGAVLLPHALYICKKCVRLMQQRQDCKIKLKKLEDILKSRYEGDVTIDSLWPKKQKDPMKRFTLQPPPLGELPNKVVIVAAGPRQASDCISGIYQRPILPKNVNFELGLGLCYERPSPVFISPASGKAVENAYRVEKNMVVPKNQHTGRTGDGEHFAVIPDLKEKTGGNIIVQERPQITMKSQNVERVNIPLANTLKISHISDFKEGKSGNIISQEIPQMVANSQSASRVNVPPTSTPNLPHDKFFVVPDFEGKTSGNVVAHERSPMIVGSQNVERVKLPFTCTPNRPNDKLVFTSDVKGKTINTIAQERPQMRTKSQNIEEVNVRPTSTPNLPHDKSLPTPAIKENVRGNILTTQSHGIPNNQEQITLPASAIGKVTWKTGERTKEDGNAAAQESSVVPINKQIKIVSKSAIKEATNKPKDVKGTTTYTFNLDVIKGSLKLSDEKTSKIVVNTLKDPALSSTEELRKMFNIPSTNANAGALVDHSLFPNITDIERPNAPLSATPSTGQQKCVIIHDNKGNITSSAHGLSDPMAEDVKKVKKSASVKITIYWTNHTRTKYIPCDLVPIGVMLVRGTYKQIALAVWKHQEIRKNFIRHLTKNILREGCGACGLGKRNPRDRGYFIFYHFF